MKTDNIDEISAMLLNLGNLSIEFLELYYVYNRQVFVELNVLTLER